MVKKNVCITKPRRFGKTSIAAMLITYYSKGINSNGIFDELKVSKGKSSDKKEREKEIELYNYYQGKYHTIYIDFSYKTDDYNSLDEYLDSINQGIKNELCKIYPNTEALNQYKKHLYDNLRNLYRETNEEFILIIDEWDYIFTNNRFSKKEKDYFTKFLKYLIKDQPYIAFTYMTGILPIAKELSQSTINCFKEYSMLHDEIYYKYFGFTEQEVKDLCKIEKKLKYEELEDWYNGYKSFNGEKIFNSWSISQALTDGVIKNYWTETGRFDELINIIDFNINGIKDDVIKLVKDKSIEIELDNYGVEDLKNDFTIKKKENDITLKKKLYAKMVSFGFLTYYQKKITIPNKEIKEIFINVLNNYNNNEHYIKLKEISKKMLNATLTKNTKIICEILRNKHIEELPQIGGFNHNSIIRIIKDTYFDARNTYDIEEDKEAGNGRPGIILRPKDKQNGTVIILELKVKDSAEKAINQIHKKNYYYGLEDKGYKGNILLVRVNCDENKNYTCIIEEYNNELKLLSSSEKKNKRKNDDVNDDGIYKRLRSKQKKKQINYL